MIGSHLLYHLVNNEKKVRALYRSKSSLDKVAKVFGYYSDQSAQLMDHIEWVEGDITDIGKLENAFEGIALVYHCAALISFDPKDFEKLEKTNVEGTANIVNLCLKHNVQKLCYVSSIAAIGSSVKGKVATEENDWNETSASVYGLTKYNAELEVWRGSQEGLPVVIVNPGVVIGPGFWKSGSGTFFIYTAKDKKHFIPGGTGFVSVQDVVNAMVSLTSSGVRSERFILVNQNLTYEQLFQKIAPKLRVQPPTKKLSYFSLEVFWRLDWIRSNLLGKKRQLSKAIAKGLYHQEVYDNSKLGKAIEFQYGDLDKDIAFCCRKFKDRQ